MTEQPQHSIAKDDIVFNCPNCQKGLAIDRDGEGLTLNCPSCEATITVPEPPASSHPLADAKDMQIEELADALENSRHRVDQLTTSLREYSDRRSHLEDLRAKNMKRFKAIADDMTQIREALGRIESHLDDAEADRPE